MSDGDGPTVDPQRVVEAYLAGDALDDICATFGLTSREAYAVIRASTRVADEADEVVVAGLLQLIDMLASRVEELEAELSVKSSSPPLTGSEPGSDLSARG